MSTSLELSSSSSDSISVFSRGVQSISYRPQMSAAPEQLLELSPELERSRSWACCSSSNEETGMRQRENMGTLWGCITGESALAHEEMMKSEFEEKQIQDSL